MRTIDIAKNVGVHVNTVRLYEQWHYISPVPRLENGYRHYSLLHLMQMKIAEIDGSVHHKDLQVILNSPKFKEEFYHVTDQLQHNLKKAMKDVKSIIAILKMATLMGMAVADQ